MENYINIDKNMVVNSTIGDTEVVWRDVRQAPFALHGFYEPLTQPYFRRVPPRRCGGDLGGRGQAQP